MRGVGTAALTSLAVFGVYASTAYPSVPGGDAGELIAEACQLGVPHPPGYPVFTVFTAAAIRLGGVVAGMKPARCANLLSCAFGALAAGAISLAVDALLPLRRSHAKRISNQQQQQQQRRQCKKQEQCSGNAFGGRPVVAAYAAFSFAFSPLVWLYAASAEVRVALRGRPACTQTWPTVLSRGGPIALGRLGRRLPPAHPRCRCSRSTTSSPPCSYGSRCGGRTADAIGARRQLSSHSLSPSPTLHFQ